MSEIENLELEVKGLIKGAVNEGNGMVRINIQVLDGSKRESFGNLIESHLRIGYSALNQSLHIIGKHKSDVLIKCREL